MSSNPVTPSAYTVPPPIPPVKKTRWGLIISGILLGLLVLIGGCCTLLFMGIHKALRSSDVYAMSMQRAQASPCAISKLGQPIVSKDSVNGSINESNGAGTADLTIPVEGPQGKGTLHAIASRDNNVWALTLLTLNQGGNEVNLPAEPGPCQ
jgi:hypothetical protein